MRERLESRDSSDEVGDVDRHLLDLCVVELLDVLEVEDVALGQEVDGHALATEAARSADTMDVVLAVGGQVVVDDEGDLLHVDAAGQQVGGDEHAGRAGSELLHDDVAFSLFHITVHGRHREVALCHRVLQPVYLRRSKEKTER